jgi:hypothetical protein
MMVQWLGYAEDDNRELAGTAYHHLKRSREGREP